MNPHILVVFSIYWGKPNAISQAYIRTGTHYWSLGGAAKTKINEPIQVIFSYTNMQATQKETDGGLDALYD